MLVVFEPGEQGVEMVEWGDRKFESANELYDAASVGICEAFFE